MFESIGQQHGNIPDIGFKFTDGKKVKNIYVTALEQKQLSAGMLSIVKHADQYELLPRPVADKIRDRDEGRVIRIEENSDVALTEEEQDWVRDVVAARSEDIRGRGIKLQYFACRFKTIEAAARGGTHLFLYLTQTGQPMQVEEFRRDISRPEPEP